MPTRVEAPDVTAGRGGGSPPGRRSVGQKGSGDPRNSKRERRRWGSGNICCSSERSAARDPLARRLLAEPVCSVESPTRRCVLSTRDSSEHFHFLRGPGCHGGDCQDHGTTTRQRANAIALCPIRVARGGPRRFPTGRRAGWAPASRLSDALPPGKHPTLAAFARIGWLRGAAHPRIVLSSGWPSPIHHRTTGPGSSGHSQSADTSRKHDLSTRR
jgi:hypothetical protein